VVDLDVQPCGLRSENNEQEAVKLHLLLRSITARSGKRDGERHEYDSKMDVQRLKTCFGYIRQLDVSVTQYLEGQRP
jgi:hypothetical protein